MASPIDTTYSFIKETTLNTTPATPVFKTFDIEQGSDLNYTAKMLNSSVLKQNRSVAGYRKAAFAAGGSLKAQLRRDTTNEGLMESVLSGAFATNVLKASNVDSSYTCEKKMVDAAGVMYFRYTGLLATKMGITVSADANAEISFDFVGMGRSTGSAILTGATYVAATQGPLLAGPDVGTITIGALTAVYTSLELSIEQNRDVLFGLGSVNGVGVGTSAPRTIKLTAKMYRKDLTVDPIFLVDTPVAVTFTIGSGVGNAYTFTLPAVVGSIPDDEVSGSSALVSVDMMAQYDPTLGTDIQITRS